VIKGKGHGVYMDRWFSNPKIFDHLLGCKTKAAGSVMSNKKEVPKQKFSGELKKGEKYHTNGITYWPSSGKTFLMSFS
jgi:hypothetical protein